MFLVKNDLVKENMALKAEFQMLTLACLNQTTSK